MQRTVHETHFNVAKVVAKEDGTYACEIFTVFVPETDEKKARKLLEKKIGECQVLKAEEKTALYILDDEIFFKYATRIEPKETTETTDTETTTE